jgi:hypothetical protein
MLGSTEGDDQNFRGDLCHYIFIGFRIIVRNGGPFLRGQRGTVDKQADSVGPWMNRRPTVAA